MTTVANVSVPADDFAFGRALRDHSDLVIELDRTVPLGETVIPYFWVSESETSTIEGSLEAENGVEEISIVEKANSEALVRVEWSESFDGLLASITETEAVILQAIGTNDRWAFELRFPDHEALTAFHGECHEHDIDLELNWVRGGEIPTDHGIGFTLTPQQRELLRTAMDAGYFSIPRETTLCEVAERLKISDVAASRRLRRGLSDLVTEAVHQSTAEE